MSRTIKGKSREELREKGQFWTPEWVAKAMIEYVSQKHHEILDLGIGKGAFFTALQETHKDSFNRYSYYGIDIDESLIDLIKSKEIYNPKNHTMEVRDFIFYPPTRKFEAIISNPPYIRHHRLSLETKNKLKQMSQKITGKVIDGRAGIHIYFLIQALSLLKKNGRLAFIVPADTCEGVFAKKLWTWITDSFCLEAIISFAPEATPFPGLDTNAFVFLISNKKQRDKIVKIRCISLSNEDLYQYIKSGLKKGRPSLVTDEVDIKQALKIGLSRDTNNYVEEKYKLSDFASVMRGIATGANDFFVMSKKQINENKIEEKYFIRCVGRTRDIEGNEITNKDLEKIEQKGRPSFLLSLDGNEISDYPEVLRNYLHQGEKKGLNEKALISTRKPWYKMEKRQVPTFLFAYLGRRNSRFIRNKTKAVPLTSFLCVYPLTKEGSYIEKLWQVLSHKDTLKNLTYVGKSYGSGAIKVEPRALEQLPLPSALLKKLSLTPPRPKLL